MENSKAVKIFTLSRHFDSKKCIQCGKCLMACPVLQLSEKTAKKEINCLITSSKSNIVLDHCTGCLTCNLYCPNDCYPLALIVQARKNRYDQNGIPIRATTVLPYFTPNVFSLVPARYPPELNKMVKQWEENWKNPPQSDIMIYSGCNTLLQPHILQSKIFKDIPIFGSPSLCCGEPLYRMGLVDAEKEIALRLKEEFSKMHFKKLLFPCIACFTTFSQLFPQVFGVKMDFEMETIIDWIYDQIMTQNWQIIPLNKTAVIHDNCWTKSQGDREITRVREILQKIGITVIEAEHTKEDALCCGMCAGAARFNMLDIYTSGRKRLKELNNTKADIIIDYCGGCNWFFNIFDGPLQLKIRPIYHLFEVISMALGEQIPSTIKTSTSLVIKSLLPYVIKGLVSSKKIKLLQIMDRLVHSTN